MGLLDLLKKKTTKQEPSAKTKPQIDVSFETPQSSNSYHYPFDEKRKSSNTDYSNVNFLCLFQKARSLSDDENEFSRFVSYDLHIYNPTKRRNDLLKKGYLRVTAPAETLATYKVTELKEILKNNGLPTTGKKDQLISRIVLSVDLEKLKLPLMCCISDKGQELIDNNKDLIKLRGNPYGVTYEEYIATKNAYPAYMGYNDLIWCVFERREKFSGGNYNVRSLNAYNRAKFLKHENKLEGALEFYLYYLYFELNDPSRVIPESIRHHFKDEEITTRQLDSYLLENIFQLKEYFDDELINRCYKRIDVPQTLIKRKDFERLLDDIFAQKKIDVRNYLPKGLR